jgi:hypothetical protein
MNVFTAGGIVAGLVVGFTAGRRWAEYWRAIDQSRVALNSRKVYRGQSTVAWVLGALAIVGVVLFFGFAPTY